MKVAVKIFLFICVFVIKSNAQNYFNKLYDYDNSSSFQNCATTIYEYNTGEFLIASTKFYSSSFGAVHMIKIDSNGDTIFSKRYPKPFCAYSTAIGNSLIECYDGSLVLTGAFYDSLATFPNALLVKLTSNGDTLWIRNYGGTNFDNANVVCQTPDSGFVLMGVTQSYSMGSASDFYLIKTDKNGVFQWQQVYGTTLAEDCLSGQVTLDGGFVLSGQKNGQFYIVKTDSLGNLQWQQSYPGTSGPCFIKQLSDSTYILSGAKILSGFAGQAHLIKINKTGSIIWQNHYGSSTANDWFYTQPVILSDGSIVVAGQQTLGSIPIGLLLKTDSLGNQQWLRTYYANPTNDNYIYDLKATSDNGFIMVGSGNITGQDAWVVKVDSAGCEIANCNVGVEEFQISNSLLQIFPNPSSSEINISIDGENLNYYDVSIVNVLGEIQKVENNQSQLNISNLANGVYFILATNKEKRYTSKFIKD